MQQKVYVRIRIDDDAMKHLIFRFFKNSIKSYTIANEIFDDLYQIFDDSNRRIKILKAYRRLKQMRSFKDFNTFWTEFQRLASDSELYNQKALLEDLKDKMFYELQKVLAIESYKASLAVELSFGQKFKPNPRVDVRSGWTDQSSQPDPRVDVRRVLPSLSETSYIWKGEKKFFVSSI